MKPVVFIQYLRPSGKTERVEIDRPLSIAEKAARIWEAGYRLEIEMLKGGLIHMTVSDSETDLVGDLAPNGPELLEAIDRMISGFHL